MTEPSVFDYLKSLFNSEVSIDIGEYLDLKPKQKSRTKKSQEVESAQKKQKSKIIFGVIFVLIGQYFLEPEQFNPVISIALYVLSAWFLWDGIKFFQPIIKKPSADLGFLFHPKKFLLFISSILLIIAFYIFSNNQFTLLNVGFWLCALILFVYSIWNPKKNETQGEIKKDHLFIILTLLTVLLTLFFRIFQIAQVPGEMFSDHAEKLLDVMDIIQGDFPIFFIRNTGREPIQFYITALIIKIFNTGFSFLSLKIGTVIFGILTLPFIYLLTKDLTNKWGGLFSLFFTGIAYWPNVISRVGLRYSLYPLFTAPALYFLIKGFREKNINSLILSGLMIGLGLHGYSSFRIVSLLVGMIFIIYLTHTASRNFRHKAIFGFLIIGLIAFYVFLPLFRYWIDNPANFGYRAFSRLTQVERTFEDPAVLIFLRNFWDSLIMPFYKNGEIWVHSIPNRPALDFVSGTFFFVGVLSLAKEILANKKWEAASLLLSIPVLMLPSTLSLAYPGENPSLNRSAGALVPIFVVTGIGFYVFITAILQIFRSKKIRVIGLVGGGSLALISVISNYQLVFNEYNTGFMNNAWNTSEIGAEISEFIHSGNSQNRAYVIPYQHWVDTRLVGFNAETPGIDYALWRDEIVDTSERDGRKIFIYKPGDYETESELKKIYPNGDASIFYSKVPGKEFIIYTVESVE